MNLLLHGCCADCTMKLIEALKTEGFKTEDIWVYFYNPNIHPRAEFQSRLAAINKVCNEKKIKLIIPDWSPKEYFQTIKLSQNRCESCWKLRIDKTMDYAKINGFEQVSTTLLSSQYQNQKLIEDLGNNLAEKYKLKFLIPKNINRELKTTGFYKQFFCGCVYSLKERFEEKYQELG